MAVNDEEAFVVGCSTPFGITEVGTHAHRPRSERQSVCAQRLSASQRSAHAVRGHGPPVLYRAQRLSASQRSARFATGSILSPSSVCSTPFGITEVGTGRKIGAFFQSGMCSTPFGITEVGTKMPWGSTVRMYCAQRLSASQRSARTAAWRRSSYPKVLNAFRHHRGRHPHPPSPKRHFDARAQRLSASQRSALASRPVRNPSGSVLNAFRHHRGRHAPRPERPIVASVCSTPFGITEVGTHKFTIEGRYEF